MKTPPPRDPESTIRLFLREQGLVERLLHTAGDAFFVVSPEQRVVFWNRRAEELTGFGAHEVLGRPCRDAIRCESCRYECRLFKQGELRETPVVLRGKSGREIRCAKNAFVLKSRAGQTIGAVEFLRDETALLEQVKRSERQREVIEARERLHDAILGSIKEGVVTVDGNLRVTSFSPRAAALTGHSAEWAVGRYCHEVIGSKLCGIDCPARSCFEVDVEEAERETQILTADARTLPVVTVTRPLRSESGDVIGAVIVLEDRRPPGSLLERGVDVGYSGMVGVSPAIQRVFRTIDRVAPTDVTVLIQGESGTGKEMVARAIHERSGRRDGPLVAVNCAALPEPLLESELFGHVRGAFTDAVRDRVGAVEQAALGTLFLDEIGELPLALQAKLLRFLQEHEYQRVGESRPRRADVRVLAATNRDLAAAVTSGRFREDLYYRIRVIPLEVPPLRERRHDAALIAVQLLPSIAARVGRPGLALTPGCLDQLGRYAWPGNVRELVNALEYAAALAAGRRIRVADLPAEVRGEAHRRYRHDAESRGDEADRIAEALSLAKGNKSHAARLLGMNRVTLYRKMKRLGLDEELPRADERGRTRTSGVRLRLEAQRGASEAPSVPGSSTSAAGQRTDASPLSSTVRGRGRGG